MEQKKDNDIFSLLGVNPESAREKAFTRGLLSSIFQAAALSGPQSRPMSGAQALGQIGLAGIEGYESSMDRTLKEMLMNQQLRASTQPKFMTIKTPDGGEALIQVPQAGVPSRVAIPGLGGAASPKFDPATSAFLSFKYPGKSYAELAPEQQREIIEFSNAPDATKAAELTRESEKARFETGVTVPVPRGRSDFLNQTAPSVSPAPTSLAPTSSRAAVAPTTAIAPIAAVGDTSMQRLSATPVSQEMTPKTAETAAIKISADIASKPLGEKEKPLIESAAITPKAKQELILAQPKQTQAVEYVLETNAQMVSVIDELLANPGFDDAFGFTGETISKIPGTNAARVRGLLTKLGGNLFIEAITAMRAASATGAAVGNATEKEGDKLEGSRAALTQAQKAEDARKELEALRDTLRFQRGLVTNAYERTYGKGAFVQREPKKAPEQRKPLQSIFGGQ
jgi:hypothetical protein